MREREQELGSDYPIRLEILLPVRNNRIFALPLLGYLLRLLFLIPHLFALWLVGLVVVAAQLILWIPVLFGGVYPKWGYMLVGGYLRWSVRANAYMLGLTDRYPPFRLSN